MSLSAEVLADSPLAYYKLDETSGTSAADSSGNGLTGTYQGSPTLGATALINVGTSVVFGSGNDVALPTNAFSIPTSISEFTFEAWFKTVSGTSRPIVSGRNSGSGNANLDFGVQSGSLYVQPRDNGGSGLITLSSPGAVNDGLAHHGVATRNSSKLWTLYVDGVSVATASDGMGTGITGLDLCFIGFEGRNLLYFDNTIDEVAVYQTALSSTRVLAHYNAGRRVAGAVPIVDRRVTRNVLLRM